FGPCGPAGDAPHHYNITVIATSVEPGQIKPGLTREELLQALRGKALAPATIVGHYVRGMYSSKPRALERRIDSRESSPHRAPWRLPAGAGPRPERTARRPAGSGS